MSSPTPPSAAPTEVARVLADHRERFLAFLERRVHDRDHAQEILQQALLTGLSRAESVRDPESTIAWFYRLLRNGLVDHYRRRAAESRAVDALAAEPLAPNEHAALHQAVCQCVSGLLETLKPEYADALRQLELEEQSLADYAAARGLTPNNAAVRAHRARKALHAQLTKMCGGCAKHGCVDCACC